MTMHRTFRTRRRATRVHNQSEVALMDINIGFGAELPLAYLTKGARIRFNGKLCDRVYDNRYGPFRNHIPPFRLSVEVIIDNCEGYLGVIENVACIAHIKHGIYCYPHQPCFVNPENSGDKFSRVVTYSGNSRAFSQI